DAAAVEEEGDAAGGGVAGKVLHLGPEVAGAGGDFPGGAGVGGGIGHGPIPTGDEGDLLAGSGIGYRLDPALKSKGVAHIGINGLAHAQQTAARAMRVMTFLR